MGFNKVQQRQIREFRELIDCNGCVSVSEWVSGSGRFSSKKALPPFVDRIEKEGIDGIALKEMNDVQKKATVYFIEHPKRKAVLVMDVAKVEEVGNE